MRLDSAKYLDLARSLVWEIFNSVDVAFAFCRELAVLGELVFECRKMLSMLYSLHIYE